MDAGPVARISPFVLVKGAGEMASAIAWRLYMAHVRRICMTDLDPPLCVRRSVAFCVAIDSGPVRVEEVPAAPVRDWHDVQACWANGAIAVMRASDWPGAGGPPPDVVIDAILAKRNLGTRIDEAALVIALGPGFEAGRDCHFVIETNRGHDLGRVIRKGSAAPNTGVPGDIAGHSEDRVLRAPRAGVFQTSRSIGGLVERGDVVGEVAGEPVNARLAGVLRGLLPTGVNVPQGLKLGDIDPRGRLEYCGTISDKARAIAGAALECVLRHCNLGPDRGPGHAC